MGDTDSVFFLIGDKLNMNTPITQRKEVFNKITVDINAGLVNAGLPNTIEVMAEEFITHIQAPDAKKSYFRNQLVLEHFFSG